MASVLAFLLLRNLATCMRDSENSQQRVYNMVLMVMCLSLEIIDPYETTGNPQEFIGNLYELMETCF